MPIIGKKVLPYQFGGPRPADTYADLIASTQSANIVGFWPLDETGQTGGVDQANDVSGNNRHGVYTGANVTYAAETGPDGNPATRTGAVTYWTVADASVDVTADEWTIVTTVQPEHIGIVTWFQLTGDSSFEQRVLFQDDGDVTLTILTPGFSLTPTTVPYTVDTWYWLACRKNADGSGTFFVNDGTGLYQIGHSSLGIQQASLGANPHLDVCLTDSFGPASDVRQNVAIWNTDLSDAELIALSDACGV